MTTIYCETVEEFVAVCAGLTRQGIVYDAYASSLRIVPMGY